ncbi:hypothetical protein J1N35_007340 [Gossypium stocksii]|uniref:Reverse transcriptase domain-containing protein n=1 Tax=Gossypium stocksii TaxID=47602 RepID=A0A9D3W6V1_9ROSI|nr:hypothetical protein J1N35_007340 [Gossypium stocksii]
MIKAKRGRDVKRLTRRLEALNGAERSEESLVKLVDVKLHLNMEMDKKERYWEQHDRANWLKMGDKNTSFFYKFASQRRRTNRIHGLQRNDGSVATNSIKVGNIARDYFIDLFESRGIGNMDHILSGIPCCISEKQKISEKGYMALKLDMSKVYDRVEWPFIKVQYLVLLNGEEGPKFNPSRGLRQGDPLSPYLFLFCGKGLFALMRLTSQERKILGAKVCRSAPPITHLMFADDCILFEEVSDRGL